MRQLYYRTNWQIKATNVRLLDETGKQIGVMPLAKARSLAKEKGLDLVEIAQRADPPIVKITDYAKFKYQQAKKNKKDRRESKKGERLKEIRLTPFIGKADLDTRISRAKGFAKNGDRVKVVVKFRGRQITQKNFGYQLLDQVKKQLADFYQPEREPKFAGRQIIMFLKPIKDTKVKKTKNETKKTKKENSQVSGKPVQNH